MLHPGQPGELCSATSRWKPCKPTPPVGHNHQQPTLDFGTKLESLTLQGCVGQQQPTPPQETRPACRGANNDGPGGLYGKKNTLPKQLQCPHSGRLSAGCMARPCDSSWLAPWQGATNLRFVQTGYLDLRYGYEQELCRRKAHIAQERTALPRYSVRAAANCGHFNL